MGAKDVAARLGLSVTGAIAGIQTYKTILLQVKGSEAFNALINTARGFGGELAVGLACATVAAVLVEVVRKDTFDTTLEVVKEADSNRAARDTERFMDESEPLLTEADIEHLRELTRGR